MSRPKEHSGYKAHAWTTFWKLWFTMLNEKHAFENGSSCLIRNLTWSGSPESLDAVCIEVMTSIRLT